MVVGPNRCHRGRGRLRDEFMVDVRKDPEPPKACKVTVDLEDAWFVWDLTPAQANSVAAYLLAALGDPSMVG